MFHAVLFKGFELTLTPGSSMTYNRGFPVQGFL